MNQATATELFWTLVEQKADIHPATKPFTFSKSFTPKEQTWDRFKTITDMTGTLPTDFTLTPQPAEKDLDQMDDPQIEPKYHPQVLRDQRLDLSFSADAPPLKEKIERGKKAKFERGGEGKAYGKNYIRKQFRSLDLSAETLKILNVPLALSNVDETFSVELPNLEELSVSGHSLSTVDNLPPSLISLNAHCNRLTAWPPLPGCSLLRHLGLSGNALRDLEGISPEVSQRLCLLSSLDLSSNLLDRIQHLKPLEPLSSLSSLRVGGNPLVLLPAYRTKTIAQLPQLLSLDGITILDTERPPPPEDAPPGDDPEGEDGEPAAEEEAGEEAKEGGEEGAEEEEGGEGGEGGLEPAAPVDVSGQFTLRFQVREIQGLKNPNPAPPEPPEGEEAPDPPPEYEFYTENPPLYWVEVGIPGQEAVKSEEIEWTETPPKGEEGEGMPKMDFELDTAVTLEASGEKLQWLRWKGVTVSLFLKKKEMPPPPKEEDEEGEEEVAPEASGESKGSKAEGEGGEEGEEEEEEQEKFVVTKLATATIPSRSLVESFAPMELKAELNKWSEKDDRTVAIDDRETEKFLQPHKPKKDRQKDFDKEMKAKKKGPPPNKKLLALLQFGVELNPEVDQNEEEAE